MLASIRDVRGLGNNTLYVRLVDASGRFWNFNSSQWESQEGSANRLFLAEHQDSDPDESRYQTSITIPSGSVLMEYVTSASGDVIGEERVYAEVPAGSTPASSPSKTLGGLEPFPTDPQAAYLPTTLTKDESADLPSSKTNLEDFVNQVRSFMRDYPELNRLVAGVESSNRQIVWAIMDALDDFNTEPPFSRFDVYDFPSRSLLTRLTVISLLESIGLLQTRNHLAFSDGGIQVGINDKTPFIQSWIQLLRQRVDEKAKRIKISYNIESAWGGGLHSEFRFVNNFYGEW